MTTIPHRNLRAVARAITITLMGLAVLVATGDGFAQSYAGLYGWAVEHGLSGWKADSFPLMVDLFIAVGEMGLFLLALDGHRLRAAAMPWLDLLTPALVAASGWGASLVFNVGHVRHDFATQATAAVPPLASMIGLLVLLRTLHRYVTQLDDAPAGPLLIGAEQATDVLDEADPFPESPALLAWLKGEDAPVPAVPPAPDPHHVAAVEAFGDEVRAGKVPSIRRIRRALHIGQPKAQDVKAYLAVLASK